ncbi:MAG: AI-2E family transporter [bacterium]
MKTEKRGFLALLFLLLLLGVYVLFPFFKTLVLGITLVILFYPLHRRILVWVGGRRRLAATLSTMALLLFILVPLGVLGAVAMNQLKEFLAAPGNPILSTKAESFRGWVMRMESWMGVPFHWREFFFHNLQNFGSYMAQYSPDVFFKTADFFYHFFIMMIVVFYLFVDGEKIFLLAVHLTPVKNRYEHALAMEMRQTVYGVFYSSFLAGLIQAVFATVGYYFAGVEAYWVWGVVTFFVSFIPVLGTSLVIVPLVLMLLFQGQTGQAVFLGLYCGLVVGLVDNLLKPLLIKSNMHPVVLFLSIFGGLTVFGATGVLIGPIIFSLLTATIKIYSKDFSDVPIEKLADLEGKKQEKATS